MRTLRFRRTKAATACRQREQLGSDFKERYKIRSGIEATNAELKGRHGAGALRARGRERVKLAMQMKAPAVNAKRASEHHTTRARASELSATGALARLATATAVVQREPCGAPAEGDQLS